MRSRLAGVLLALMLYGGLTAAAQAEPVPFSCTTLPGGKSVRVAISNPFNRETSCQVNCQFSTTARGTSIQLSCSNTVAAGAKDVQLCVRDSGKETLVKMIGGDGDCVKQLTEEEENEREKKSDEEDDELIRKLQRQGQDFINRNKPK